CLVASFDFCVQAEDGIRDFHVTGVQTCALPISHANMFSNRKSFATPSRLTSHSVIAAKWVGEQIMATSSLLYTQTFESVNIGDRSEERRVGKEWRSRWWRGP